MPAATVPEETMMTSVVSMRLTTASTMRSILSLATEKSSSVGEEEPIFTTIRFAELICARKVASRNRSDRDSEVVEELMQVILTLPAVFIRSFSGNFLILTEIVRSVERRVGGRWRVRR